MVRPVPVSPGIHLVLPAAGSGQRMAGDRPKQYLEILGRSVLQHTLERLGSFDCLDKLVLVLSDDDPWWPAVEARLPPAIRARLSIAPGGRQRSDSVRNGLLALQTVAKPDDFVMVHDVVRPCVRLADVQLLVDTVRDEIAGGLLATPLRDTLKRSDGEGRVEQTIDRSRLWCAATPQMFRYRILLDALDRVALGQCTVTDEAEAVEALGFPVKLVQGHGDNLKLTYPEDLQLAALILGATH